MILVNPLLSNCLVEEFTPVPVGENVGGNLTVTLFLWVQVEDDILLLSSEAVCGLELDKFFGLQANIAHLCPQQFLFAEGSIVPFSGRDTIIRRTLIVT